MQLSCSLCTRSDFGTQGMLCCAFRYNVLYVLNELNKKAGINFNIDVNRPPKTEEWSCSLKFMGNDEAAENNSDLCLFLERYADERESLEQGFSNEDRFNHWFETEL